MNINILRKKSNGKLREDYTVKVTTLTKATSSKIPFFNRSRRKPKINIEMQKDPPNSQNNLEEETQSWGISLPNFKIYYKAMIIRLYGSHIKTYVLSNTG